MLELQTCFTNLWNCSFKYKVHNKSAWIVPIQGTETLGKISGFSVNIKTHTSRINLSSGDFYLCRTPCRFESIEENQSTTHICYGF